MTFALAGVVVVALWWLSTAVVLRLVWLPRRLAPLTLALATPLGVLSLLGLAWTAHRASVPAALLAMVCALGLWGWHELAFLLGMITGPGRGACPPGASTWQRFRAGTLALLHHELALLVTVGAVLYVVGDGVNGVGVQAFLVLWVMRVSAKLNVFLGVRNISDEFLPPHLGHLASFFRRARINPLMPVSILGGGAVAASLFWQAAAAADGSPAQLGPALVGTLMGLAVLEHVFLAMPAPDALLWRWVLPRQSGDAAQIDGGA